MMIRRGQGGGFTLLEVMFALGTLALGLGFLLSGAAANMTATRRAQMTTAATELARSKMLDIEEILLHEGFQELEQELEGDFEEEGWESIRWEAKIMKIELPNIGAMESLSGEGEEGAESGEDAAATSPLAGFLGMGAGAGDGGAGAGLIQSQFETFRNILEASIRKVVLKVAWKSGADEEHIVVDCYFTDPSAISRVLQGLPAQAAGGEEDAGDGQSGDDPAGGGDKTRGGGNRGGGNTGGGRNTGGDSARGGAGGGRR